MRENSIGNHFQARGCSLSCCFWDNEQNVISDTGLSRRYCVDVVGRNGHCGLTGAFVAALSGLYLFQRAPLSRQWSCCCRIADSHLPANVHRLCRFSGIVTPLHRQYHSHMLCFHLICYKQGCRHIRLRKTTYCKEKTKHADNRYIITHTHTHSRQIILWLSIFFIM